MLILQTAIEAFSPYEVLPDDAIRTHTIGQFDHGLCQIGLSVIGKIFAHTLAISHSPEDRQSVRKSPRKNLLNY